MRYGLTFTDSDPFPQDFELRVQLADEEAIVVPPAEECPECAECPPRPTFTRVEISGLAGDSDMSLSQLRYGIGTAGRGYSTDQSSFLAENPGLAFIDFATITPGVWPYASTIAAFTSQTAFGTNVNPPIVWPGAGVGQPINCFDILTEGAGVWLSFTFSTPISAVGFLLASFPTTLDMTLKIYNGATLIFSLPLGFTTGGMLVNFRGYAA